MDTFDMTEKNISISRETPTVRISVRNLVEFILREGDIDNRGESSPDSAMAEGSRLHRLIQKKSGTNYLAEVTLKYEVPFDDFRICVEGRADGVIVDETMDSSIKPKVTIDEIKCTYADIYLIKQPILIHLAQAKCYAYIYAKQNNLERISIRMTYCNIETEDIRYFTEELQLEALEKWFDELMHEYYKWAKMDFEWKEKKIASIKQLEFPFAYREGQRDFVTYVYRTVYHKKKMFVQAPTGVGKTISTVFPAVKAVGEGLGDKIFYLTAKTITRTVAADTFRILKEQGMEFKSVILTAKEKICPLDEMDCNPDYCPYAKGHYDRANDALFDILIHETDYTRELIEQYALKHDVCPFELSLDITLFSDGIICDYNYLFDPHVYLRRFFANGESDHLFLVDEAHNLLDRGREMYSAVLKKEDFLILKRRIKDILPKIAKQLDKCNKELLALKRECSSYLVLESVDGFVVSCTRLYSSIERYLQSKEHQEVRKEILDFYFELSHFLMIRDRMDDNYVIYSQLEEDGGFSVKLFCVDPSVNLRECMDRGRSTILFSATLLPMQYFKRLLGGTSEDYDIYAKSTFSPEQRALLIADDVTSKYTRRSESEYERIAQYIKQITTTRRGNYIIFFPSYRFLNDVYQTYLTSFYDEELELCLIQENYMNEAMREEFLDQFQQKEDKTLIAFCVLGGIFSEGIDLKEESLIGAIIVGTGLPQISNERKILEEYFMDKGHNGFDYAYRFPGMNKVLQAAGRVIRTNDDIGVIALLDERFHTQAYRNLFPQEWSNCERVNINNVTSFAEKFWEGWYT